MYCCDCGSADYGRFPDVELTVSPTDLIPDFIPVVGYIDDAAVFAACVSFVREDLEKYRQWKFAGDVVGE